MFNSQAVSVEEPEWDQFWEQESPKLLLYACQHGTVDMVDYFITREVSATTRYVCIEPTQRANVVVRMSVCILQISFSYIQDCGPATMISFWVFGYIF